MKSSDDSRLRDASNGLLHQLGLIDIHDELPEEQAVSSDHQLEDPPPAYDEATKGLHVMISYNWDHQERVIQMANKLKVKGYNVWIDVDKMSKFNKKGPRM